MFPVSFAIGAVDTPCQRERLRVLGDYEKYRKELEERHKMKRIGTSQEIAHLAVYLASDESDFVTGQEFIIDGGYTL